MFIFSIIALYLICAMILAGLAWGVCIVGTRTEGMAIVMLTIIGTFLVSYVVLDLMYSLLVELSDVPALNWNWKGK